MKKHLNTTKLVLSKNIMLIAVVLLLLIIGVIASQPKFFSMMVKDSQMIYTPIGHKWHKIDLRRFSLNTPEEYQYVREQGIDSYVGVITNGADTIYFDYGWYSNDLNDAVYLRSYDTINGVPAITVYSTTSHVGVHFPQIVDQNKLTLFSKTLTKELAYQIFKSIKFPGHSGRTTEVLGQNTVNDGFAPGKQIFESNCATCHDFHYKIIGPALSGVIERKGEEWVTHWIENPGQYIQTNKQAAQLFKNYGETPHLAYRFDKQQLELLLQYIEQN